MRYRYPYIWKQAPFLRLLLPFMAGILLQYYCPFPMFIAWIAIPAAILFLLLFNRRSSFLQWRFAWLNGAMIIIIFLSLGFLTGYYNDNTHRIAWYGNHIKDGRGLVINIEEPLTERPKSFKTSGAVRQIIADDSVITVNGSLLIYFQKDSLQQIPGYGARILVCKPLQPIKGSGNPGAFDYQRYAALQGLYHQLYLKRGDYILLDGRQTNWFDNFLFSLREKVLHALKTYIPGEKEAGMAEALLVGYKEDLDKDLVQSYSNTGVVHVIAISGMHLGLIYWLLNLLFIPFKGRKKLSWVKAVCIISGLWLFALLAGGGPSILRSAVMFTCIIIGDNLSRKASIYNSLAASAFILLCFHPGWLWDVGFQLSYIAVLSIVVFMQPVYHLMYVKNKLLDTLWKLTAVTFAAQLLTVPLCVYHFHQFPNYFLIANMVAVPLSGLVVLGEILLCAVAAIPVAANIAGSVLHTLIYWMNGFIERLQLLPHALWDGLQVNLLQTICMYIIIAGFAYWLLQKSKKGLFAGLLALLLFLSIKIVVLNEANHRTQLVVYNVPSHEAMDIICGGQYLFTGDSDLIEGSPLVNLQLNPYRRMSFCKPTDSLPGCVILDGGMLLNHKRIVVLDTSISTASFTEKINADIVVISQHPTLNILSLLQKINCSQLVIDASNPVWKVNKWKEEAGKAGLSCFSVVDNGAFVMNLN